MSNDNIPFRKVSFPSAEMRVTTQPDGSLLVTPQAELAEFVPNLPLVLSGQAVDKANQAYLKERGPDDAWVGISYAETFARSSAVATWLLGLGIEEHRPMLILSGNSIHHAIFKYGAMAARVPVCPVSINYALMGGDYGRLKHVLKLLAPAVIFAEQTDLYAAALESVDFADAIIVTSNPQSLDRDAISIAEVLDTPVDEDLVSRSINSIDPDEPSVLMLTSGSTSLPKAVIQTQRMIAANLAQGCQVLGETAGWDDQMLDWLPWNHVSGAFTKLGVMVSGGTLHIDAGRPMPGEFTTTVKNLKDVPVKFFTNVPAGYAMLADEMDRDPELKQSFFKTLRLALYGGAGLPQALYDRLQSYAIEVTGKRVFFTTGYGATETSSGCMAIYFDSEEVGIGLPMPGLTIKLVPQGPRYEVRMHGQMITPGYVGTDSPEMFDDDGFLRIGDYAQFIEPGDISKGLKFAGRLAEEFKLANGTWVSGGGVRAAIVQSLAPIVSDALVCGLNAEYLGALLWLNRPAAERHFDRKLPTSAEDLAGDEQLRAFITEQLGSYNADNPGSSTRINRVAFLTEPPSVDAHEISDKGTINQSAALQRRATDVEKLYESSGDEFVITLD